MASAVSVVDLFANAAINMYDHDPGATTAMLATTNGTTQRWVPIADFHGFAGIVMATIATTGPTDIGIVAATDASGTDKTTVVSTGTIAADAVGDVAVIECSAAQIKEVGDAAGKVFTHVSVGITCGNSGDECAVTFIRHTPKYPQAGLTANAIS